MRSMQFQVGNLGTISEFALKTQGNHRRSLKSHFLNVVYLKQAPFAMSYVLHEKLIIYCILFISNNCPYIN
jgi:hypothetical protein